MIRIFIIFMLFLSAQIARADEESDKTEFKKLYAEFNELYANSKEIDPIIEVAEKLYKIAPELYGENSQNAAVVTYNLASLYDEKGGDTYSDDEKKAAELYESYFKIFDKNGSPQDQNYFSQMVSFVYAESNANRFKSKNKFIKKAIEIAEKTDIPNSTIANYELNFGLLKYKNGQVLEAEDLFESSLQRYENEFGENHFKVGENLFWLAKISLAKSRETTSANQFLRALEIFQKEESEAAKTLAQSTHAFLVQVYEDQGKSGEATKHCRAIAVERQTDFDAYLDPLYRKAPDFPNLKSYEFSKV